MAIDCYNEKSSLPKFLIILLMEDVWRLVHNLNIYNYYHVYQDADKTTDCLTKKM